MNFVRLNKIVGILCLALIPVVVVLVTLTGNQEQGELAAKWLMVLLAVWLPFLCLRCIQVGHIYLPTQGDIYKNERTIPFGHIKLCSLHFQSVCFMARLSGMHNQAIKYAHFVRRTSFHSAAYGRR